MFATPACLQWLVPTSLSETQTVLQNFSAPNCDSDPSRDWVTYIIYKVRTPHSTLQVPAS